jgi:DNA phosphorothioation-associated putative methyltransferase
VNTPPQTLRAGKRVGGATYIHRSALDLLDQPARRAVEKVATLSPWTWNVAKIAREGVSLLEYEEFDENAFPRLLASTALRGDKLSRIDYRNRVNPPILHRKELLLRPEDPRIALFEALTRAADERGLFAAPHLIGTMLAWQRRLEDAGLAVRGHLLVEKEP